MYFGSIGCHRIDIFGFCALYLLCAAGTAGNNPDGSTAEVLLLYHSSRSAKSTSKL